MSYGRVSAISTKKFLADVDQMSAWHFVLSQNVDLHQYITNPLRPDRTPKCYLREGRGGFIVMADFANNEFHNISVIDAFSRMENISYPLSRDILYSVIVNGYQYKRVSRPSITVGNMKIFSADSSFFNIDYVPFKSKDGSITFVSKDESYWRPREVTTTQLLEDGVHSVYAYFVPWLNEVPKDRCYAYTFLNGNTKLYFPDRKKFISTCTENDVWDWSKGATTKIAVYCKSYKDGRMFKNMFPDLRVYAFQNEGCRPYHLEQMIEFHDENYFFFDNDKGGISAMQSMLDLYPSTHAFTVPNFQGVTDFDELFLSKGKKYTHQTLLNILHEAKEHKGILVPRTTLVV